MISTPNLQLAKEQIKKSGKPIIVQAQNEEFNRKILEYGKFDVLLEVENNHEKIKLKRLNSGFNHVLAKIAAKNKVAIGIDLSYIRSLEGKPKAITLTKIIENIRVARKAKCNLALLNSKDKIDAFEFLISLGASTQQAKKAASITF